MGGRWAVANETRKRFAAFMELVHRSVQPPGPPVRGACATRRLRDQRTALHRRVGPQHPARELERTVSSVVVPLGLPDSNSIGGCDVRRGRDARALPPDAGGLASE